MKFVKKLKIQRKLLICVSLSALMFVSLIPCNVVAASSDDGDGNNLNLNLLQYGDIILSKGGKFEDIIPGPWDHAMIYVGYGYHLDSQTNLKHWGYFIVESISEGVVYSGIDRIHVDDEVILLRVQGTTYTQRNKAIEYAETYADGAWEGGKWVWGERTEYDYYLINGMDSYSKFYCSELVCKAYDWAMDGAPGNPWNYRYDNSDGNLNTIDDDPGWSGFDYFWACAPSEIYDSSRTTVIAHAS